MTNKGVSDANRKRWSNMSKKQKSILFSRMAFARMKKIGTEGIAAHVGMMNKAREKKRNERNSIF